MRQRTISDYFWRDPEISDLSQEDKATLLYFLTSPSSNIIGVYQIVWRIAAAEMGWTKDQLLVVAERLQNKKLIYYTNEGWIWVKIWWKHNSAIGAFSPKLIGNAKKQCSAMPIEWLNEFLETLEIAGVNSISIGYGYPIDMPSPNTTCISISNTTTTTELEEVAGCEELEFPKGLRIEEIKPITELIQKVQDLPLARKQALLDELANAINCKKIREGVVPYLRELIRRELQGEFIPSGGASILSARHASDQESITRKSNVQDELDPQAYAKGKELFPHLGNKQKRLSESH